MMMKNLKVISIGIACLMQTSCISLLPGKESRLKVVSLPSTESTFHNRSVIKLRDPEASQLYDSQRIVIEKTSKKGLTYLAHLDGYRWPERLPTHIKRQLNQDLDILSSDAFGVKQKLLLDIHQLKIIEGESVNLWITAKLKHSSTDRLIKQHSFKVIQTSPLAMTSVMKAFNKAWKEFTINLNDWLHGQKIEQ